MIQIDFTQEIVEVLSETDLEGGIRFITGCESSGEEGCWKIEGNRREELPPCAGARIHEGGTLYYTRERYLHEQGTYEVRSQLRNGTQRKFLIDLLVDDKLINDQDPVRQEHGKDLVINFEDSPSVWDRVQGEDPV